jgi:hypothetical protein
MTSQDQPGCQADIVADGKTISRFKHFRLKQSARKHHSFELILAHDSLEEIQDHNLEGAQQFLGKTAHRNFQI